MRFPDWHIRLAEEIKAAEQRPFSYGRNDCLQFVARCVCAMTGVNHASQYSYSTEAEARALIDGAGGLAGLITRALGQPISPTEAREGDIGIAHLDCGETACVCNGPYIVFADGHSAPRSELTQAWRVS